MADGNLGRERSPASTAVSRPVRRRHRGHPDEPGSLGTVFADIAAAGTNVEELALEHAPGRAVGLLEMSVLPAGPGT